MDFYIEMVDEFKKKKQKLPRLYYSIEKNFAPIYDNGSSLGRELAEGKVEFYLSADKELEGYLHKGLSEIHWQNKKISHFELIRNLLNTPYKEKIKNVLERMIERYNGSIIEQLIQRVDLEVPETLSKYKIPESRKQLIFKIITFRFEKLRTIINEGV